MIKYRLAGLAIIFVIVCASVCAGSAYELIDERSVSRYSYKVYLIDDHQGNRQFMWDIGISGSQTLTGIAEEGEGLLYFLHSFREAVIQVQRSTVSLAFQSAYLLLVLLVIGVYVRKKSAKSLLLPLPLLLIIIIPLIAQSISGLYNALSEAEYYFQYIQTVIEG